MTFAGLVWKSWNLGFWRLVKINGCLCGNDHLIAPIWCFFSPLNQDLNEDYEIHFSFHLDFDSMTQSFPLKIVFSMVDCKEESNYDLALFFYLLNWMDWLAKKEIIINELNKKLAKFSFHRYWMEIKYISKKKFRKIDKTRKPYFHYLTFWKNKWSDCTPKLNWVVLKCLNDQFRMRPWNWFTTGI